MKRCLGRREYMHVILVALATLCLCACSQKIPHARLSAEQINALHSQWHQFEQAGRIGELDINEINALIEKLDGLSKDFEVRYEDMILITGRNPDITDKSWTAEYFLSNDKSVHVGMSFLFHGKGRVVAVNYFMAID